VHDVPVAAFCERLDIIINKGPFSVNMFELRYPGIAMHAIDNVALTVVRVGLAIEGVIGIASVKVILHREGMASFGIDWHVEKQAHRKCALIHDGFREFVSTRSDAPIWG
jgi:hypothetical protein